MAVNGGQACCGLYGTSAVTLGETIHFPAFVSSCANLITCEGGAYASWLVHELAHVWQFQRGVDPVMGHLPDIARNGNYTSVDEYHTITNPFGLSTERQADWFAWNYQCGVVNLCPR